MSEVWPELPAGFSLPVNLVIGRMYVRVTADKIVVGRRDRPELPHLTVLRGRVTDELDVHLTWGDGVRYESLLKVPFDHAAAAVESAIDRHLVPLAAWAARNHRPYRPGWLRRNGYVVCWTERQELLEHALASATRLKRRKFRVHIKMLLRGPRSDDGAIATYDPDLLHLLPRLVAERPLYVGAVCRRAHRPGPSLFLGLGESPGRPPLWSGFPLAGHAVAAQRMSAALFMESGGLLFPLFARVYEAMALRELGVMSPDEAEGKLKSPRPWSLRRKAS